jgi:MFS family permease
VIRAREREAVERYRANAPHFRRLAATAVPALASVMGLALAAFLWNHRRLPHGVPQRASRRRVWRRVASRLLERGMAPAPTAQAGFFFTLQVLPRSAAHRVVMSSTLAAGLASLVAAFSGVALTGIDGPPARLGVWAAQTLLLAAVLCGLRHAVRVPAELKASSSFLIAWSGDEREYLSGVKRAALTALALPVIVVMLPLHVILLGPRLAMLHALCGLAIAVVLLDALTCGLRRLPFVCAYVAAGSFKRAAPIFLAGGLVGCYAFAGIERAASQRALGVAALIAVLGLVAWLLRWWGRAGRHDAPDLDIDLAPDAVVTMDLRG